MNTYTLLIILCGLVIFSYLFDLIARQTRFPSVLLLLLTGIGTRLAVDYFHLPTVNFLQILPALGTIGLILIVLEGALELKYNRTKNKLIFKAFMSALVILLATTTAIGFLFHWLSQAAWKTCAINAIPFSIISSAIAIPSVVNMDEEKKEFVIYESSISDILGIILFYFMLLNKEIGVASFVFLARDTFLIILISILFCLLLLFIIGRIRHQVKFFLVISIVILVYSAGRLLNLPSLLIVLAFGLFLGNAEQIRIPLFRKTFLYEDFKNDLNQLFRLSSESAFLVRTFFFAIFGFIMNLDSLKNTENLIIGFMILAIIYIIRAFYLKYIGRIKLLPELFLGPRGLISILLFLYIPEEMQLTQVNTGLLFLVILATSLIMSAGLLIFKKKTV